MSAIHGTLVLAAVILAILLPKGSLFAQEPARASQPNIVVVLADDLGYGDVQCYNPQRGRIPTPHVDGLAQQGMRFTDAHSSSGVCSPSRYTLLTGRYHWRTRLQAGIVRYLEEPLIAKDRLTLGSLLQQQGYHTACVGKWHLGWDWQIPEDLRPLFAPRRGEDQQVTERHRQAWRDIYSLSINGGPISRGFHEYFGTDVPNWPPYCFIENDRTQVIPTEFLPAHLLRDNLAGLAGPAQADWKLEGILPALADRACQVIQQQSKAGKPYFVYLPLTTPHTPLAVNPAWQGKSGLNERVADLIMETDDAVGRVLAAIESSGQADNTLVIFTSDNGFAPYAGAEHLEQQGHYPSGPLRGYKADAWEGGHRVPFIVRWPAVVKSGTVCNQLVHQADVMATLAQVMDVKLPENAGEDSFSLLPLLQGADQPVREHAISHGLSGLPTLRLGQWKMIFGPGGGGYSDRNAKPQPNQPPAQLYDLSIDLSESKNVYAEHPEMIQKMQALMKQLVEAGRSTPGPKLANDVPVDWRQFLPSSDKPSGTP